MIAEKNGDLFDKFLSIIRAISVAGQKKTVEGALTVDFEAQYSNLSHLSWKIT